MAAQSSVLAWRIPGMGEPGGLPSMGSHSQTQLKGRSSSKDLNLGKLQEMVRDKESRCAAFCGVTKSRT